jgi:hypothetical protein
VGPGKQLWRTTCSPRGGREPEGRWGLAGGELQQRAAAVMVRGGSGWRAGRDMGLKYAAQAARG